jgi:hypothetical protein
MTDGGEGTVNTFVTEESRAKMSEKAKGTKTYDKNGMSKIVEQYTMDGVFLNRFTSLRAAAEFVDGDFKILSNCCRGVTKSAYGYKWMYVGKSYTPPIKPEAKSKRKKVYQYTLEGEFVQEFESLSAAEKAMGIRHISCVCLGKLNFSGGYQWRYEFTESLPPLTFEKTKNLSRFRDIEKKD